MRFFVERSAAQPETLQVGRFEFERLVDQCQHFRGEALFGRCQRVGIIDQQFGASVEHRTGAGIGARRLGMPVEELVGAPQHGPATVILRFLLELGRHVGNHALDFGIAGRVSVLHWRIDRLRAAKRHVTENAANQQESAQRDRQGAADGYRRSPFALLRRCGLAVRVFKHAALQFGLGLFVIDLRHGTFATVAFQFGELVAIDCRIELKAREVGAGGTAQERPDDQDNGNERDEQCANEKSAHDWTSLRRAAARFFSSSDSGVSTTSLLRCFRKRTRANRPKNNSRKGPAQSR